MKRAIRGVGRFRVPGDGLRLGVLGDDVRLLDPARGDLGAIVARCADEGAFVEALTELADAHEGDSPIFAQAKIGTVPGSKIGTVAAAPVDRQECWGAGCTYQVDAAALKQMRADRPLYADAYEARRPMLFFKGNADRVAGPGSPIVCRPGALRTIPEAELAVLLSREGEPLAYCLGNDVTALDLEQANSLYQPQAKVFDGGAALGPWWTLASAAPGVLATPFTCTVVRGGENVLAQTIDPGRLARSIEELVGWLFEASSFPEGVVLMTGGGASVPPDFALAGGDVVTIAHPVLGELSNPVVAL